MDLKGYLIVLKANVWVFLTTVITTLIVVTVVTILMTPMYMATTTLRIATASSGVAGYYDYMYADRLMNTYTKLATSQPVINELITSLGLSIVPDVKVETVPNTELIRISVEAASPQIAQNSANALADILVKQGRELYSGGGKSAQEILSEQLTQAEGELRKVREEYDEFVAKYPNDTVQIAALNDAIQLKEKTYATLLDQYDQARLKEILRANLISVVEPAAMPVYPSKPNIVLNIGLGLAVGSAGGLGLAFFLENLGNRLYTSKQIEALSQFNLVGKIPPNGRKKKKGANNDHAEKTPFREAFRRLQIHLLVQNPNHHQIKSLLITSSEPGEGKSTITANLGISIAQSDQKVIIVDCDLHLPTQHNIHGLSNQIGVSSVLGQQLTLSEAVQHTRYRCLDVLTSGPLPSAPANLLGSSQMKTLIYELLQEYEVVLFDTPAMLVVADTAILTTMVDGVALVVRRNFIREEAVRETCRLLKDINAPTVGVIVNDAEANGSYYYYQQK